MFDIDLLISFLLMSVLFLRQIIILKQPNKIDYAPLMLGVGAISSVLHFILHPDSTHLILMLRESLIPILVALILYLIMNILHQTQTSAQAKIQEEFSQVLVYELSQLKAFILELEDRMQHTQEVSLGSQETMHKNFINDIKILNNVLQNQEKFLHRFDDMQVWHQEVNDAFKYFSEVQLPELDNVVHKHIDILRIAEQDHYNKLSVLMQKAVESRFDIAEDLQILQLKMEKMGKMSDSIAENITEKTFHKLTNVTKAFESEIILLKSHTEGLRTSLNEGETTLSNIKIQSEMLMKQMVLSSKKMDELELQNEKIQFLFHDVNTVVTHIQKVREDYIQAQEQLLHIVEALENTKTQEIVQMTQTVSELTKTLSDKVDASLEKLHEHYHITSEDISQSVKILAKKAQLQKGYGES